MSETTKNVLFAVGLVMYIFLCALGMFGGFLAMYILPVLKMSQWPGVIACILGSCGLFVYVIWYCRVSIQLHRAGLHDMTKDGYETGRTIYHFIRDYREWFKTADDNERAVFVPFFKEAKVSLRDGFRKPTKEEIVLMMKELGKAAMWVLIPVGGFAVVAISLMLLT